MFNRHGLLSAQPVRNRKFDWLIGVRLVAANAWCQVVRSCHHQPQPHARPHGAPPLGRCRAIITLSGRDGVTRRGQEYGALPVYVQDRHGSAGGGAAGLSALRQRRRSRTRSGCAGISCWLSHPTAQGEPRAQHAQPVRPRSTAWDLPRTGAPEPSLPSGHDAPRRL